MAWILLIPYIFEDRREVLEVEAEQDFMCGTQASGAEAEWILQKKESAHVAVLLNYSASLSTAFNLSWCGI